MTITKHWFYFPTTISMLIDYFLLRLFQLPINRPLFPFFKTSHLFESYALMTQDE